MSHQQPQLVHGVVERPAGSVLRTLFLFAVCVSTACTDGSDEQSATQLEAEKHDATSSETAEAVSLLGEELFRLELPPATQEEFEEKLDVALSNQAAAPDTAEGLIWVGRRTAYLGRYNEAIELFGQGVQRFPEDARFLRHRGHRYLSTRQLQEAVDDFSRAYEMIQGVEDEIEPDGMPNAQGIPTSTLHSNIRYHLGLAHYLRGDFGKALPLYEEDVAKANNEDMRIASTYWLYLTLRRLGDDVRAAEIVAAVDPELEIIENHDYHRLLLYFQGEKERSVLLGEDGDGGDTLQLRNATLGYGVATYDLVEERRDQALEGYRAILTERQWASFGYLAAEAELARLRP